MYNSPASRLVIWADSSTVTSNIFLCRSNTALMRSIGVASAERAGDAGVGGGGVAGTGCGRDGPLSSNAGEVAVALNEELAERVRPVGLVLLPPLGGVDPPPELEILFAAGKG